MIFNFSTIHFLKSAATLAQCPSDQGKEIAFVGRSNAGKSSAINAITGHAKLARTSKTPGRTQLMNFFEIRPEQRLVDLPGYGYANIPTSVQREIESFLSAYLHHRESVCGLILLMDIRHPLTESDQLLLQLAEARHLPVHILLTKCDKLKHGARQDTLLATRRALASYTSFSVQTFSALKKIGLKEVHQQFQQWFEISI